jgi:hypothetical protein
LCQKSCATQFASVFVAGLIRPPVTHATRRIASLGASFLIFAQGIKKAAAHWALAHTNSFDALERGQEVFKGSSCSFLGRRDQAVNRSRYQSAVVGTGPGLCGYSASGRPAMSIPPFFISW